MAEQNKGERGSGGNGRYAATLPLYIPFGQLGLFNSKNYKTVIFYYEESRGVRGREKGKRKRDTSQGCGANGKSPALPVPTVRFWTLDTTPLFPLSLKRNKDVLSILQLKFLPLFMTFRGLLMVKLFPKNVKYYHYHATSRPCITNEKIRSGTNTWSYFMTEEIHMYHVGTYNTTENNI